MATTEEIRISNSTDKTSEYIELINSLYEDAKDTAEVTGNIFVTKIVEEMEDCLKKALNADCEYTVYVNCNAIEIWHSKIDEQF